MTLRRFRFPALICVIVICFFWKLVLTNQYTWLQAPDFASQLLPWYQFQAGEWHAGRIPLWNPYEWTGQSLIGQAQPGVVDPLNLLLYAAPLKNGWIAQWALHWFFVAGYMAGALAFYGFCRRGLLLSSPASLVACLGYALGGIPASTNWPQMMHATIWGPLALLFQFRAVRDATPIRHGAYSGAFLGIMWLSGHHQIPLYFTFASAALWIYFLYTRFVTKPGILRAACAAGLFLVLFGTLQILPAAEYGQHALRWVGHEDPVGWQDKVPYNIHQQFSMRPLGLLSVFLKTNEQYEPFMGVTLIVLAALGIATGWRTRPAVRWLVWLGSAAILYAFGANGFLQGPLYALLPTIEKARVPAVAMILFNVAAAALAAYGVDGLQAPVTRIFARICGTIAALMMTTAVVLAMLRYIHASWTSEWILATFGFALTAAVFYLKPRWAPAFLAAGILIEVSFLNGGDWQNQSMPKREHFAEQLARNSDIATFLYARPGNFRVRHNTVEIPFSFGNWWGFETLEAFDASIPKEIWDIDVFDRALEDFASIRYYLSKEPLHPDLVPLFTSASGLRVFENPRAFARAWVVHRVLSVANADEAKAWMKSAGDARKTEAVVYGAAPAVDACGDGDIVQFTRRVPNEISLQVNAACKGLLVLNDAWFPGWDALVDGRRQKLYQTDGFVRGVVVDKGPHKIVFIYRPVSVGIGAAFLLLGCVGIAILTRLSKPGTPKASREC